MAPKEGLQAAAEDDVQAQAAEEEGDDSSSSSGSDSDSEVEVDAEDMNKIMELEAELERAPAYDPYMQYLELLRKAKLRERLRTARTKMHALFPFNESMWMDWINDELDAVRDADDVARVGQLYKDAVKDYLSVSIWVAYLQFLLDLDAEVTARTAAGIDAFRAAAEEAIAAAGVHLAEGIRLWVLYRGFEQTLLDEADGNGSKAQRERVRSLWHRQLAVPLAGSDAALQEYEEWEGKSGQGSVPQHVRKAYEKAQEGVSLRRAHEEACAADKPVDEHLLAAYMAYIQLERVQGDPARVQVMYERALAAFPVTADLWRRYTRYQEVTLNIPDVINATYTRAVRNCPWNGELWARALRALEATGTDVAAEHEALYQQALQAGLQGPEDYMEVLLARADFLRRCAAAASASGNALPTAKAAAATALQQFFGQAEQLMAQYWPQHLDRSLRLPYYHAHCLARVLGDAGAAKEVWEGVLKGPLGKFIDPWSAYAAMERSLGRIAEARAVYRRAYARRLEEGAQLAVCYEWLRFEHEEGSADDYLQASIKVEPILEEARATMTAIADGQAAADAKHAARSAPQLTPEEMTALRRGNDPNFKPKAKSAKKRDRAEEATDDAVPAKRTKGPGEEQHAGVEAPQAPAAGEGPTAMDEDEPAAHVSAAAARPAQEGSDVPSTSGAAERKPPFKPSDEHTVFVKHLDINVTKEDVEKLFAPVGGMKDVRMKTHEDGTSKGFAYIEFEDDESVQKAVQQLNGTTFHGRQLFVAKSEPPKPGGNRGGRGGPRGGRGGFRGGYDGGRGRGGDYGGGRGRGRGENGHDDHGNGPGGRRGGLGYGGRGRGQAAALGYGVMQRDKPHQHLQLGGGGPPVLLPRSVAAGKSGKVADEAPKSNDDFRKMLLAKKQ